MKPREEEAILDSSITPSNLRFEDAGHSDQTENAGDCGKGGTQTLRHYL